MLDKLLKKFKEEDIEDYEVVDKLPKDSISVSSDITKPEIFIPEDFEYDQYKIDDLLRKINKFNRTSVTYDRKTYIMSCSDSLTLVQFCKLIKYIIEEEGFCSILDD